MGSLKQYDTPKNQVDELKVSTKPKDKVVVWVEGNDWKLYHRFFNADMVDKQGRKGGHTCHSAIESYEEFKKQYPSRLAIVIKDADFMRINGEDLERDQDIFYADCHDHEMMCIYQDKVREVLLSNFLVEDSDDTFYKRIFDELLLLSFFQWYNYNNVCAYDFDRLGNLFDMSQAFFHDLAIMENEVFVRTQSERKKKNIKEPLERIDLKELSDFIKSHPSPDCYEITNGHDFYNRINYYLQKINKNNVRSEETLKDTIYAAFSFVFKNTQLYARLNSWCERNKTYILKAC